MKKPKREDYQKGQSGWGEYFSDQEKYIEHLESKLTIESEEEEGKLEAFMLSAHAVIMSIDEHGWNEKNFKMIANHLFQWDKWFSNYCETKKIGIKRLSK